MPFIFFIFLIIVLIRIGFAIRTIVLRRKVSPAGYLLKASALADVGKK